MDPKECLKNLREAVDRLERLSTLISREDIATAAEDVVDHFRNLDEWLRRERVFSGQSK